MVLFGRRVSGTGSIRFLRVESSPTKKLRPMVINAAVVRPINPPQETPIRRTIYIKREKMLKLLNFCEDILSFEGDHVT